MAQRKKRASGKSASPKSARKPSATKTAKTAKAGGKKSGKRKAAKKKSPAAGTRSAKPARPRASRAKATPKTAKRASSPAKRKAASQTARKSTKKRAVGEGVEVVAITGKRHSVTIKRVRPAADETPAERAKRSALPLSKRIAKADLETIKEKLFDRRRVLLGSLSSEYVGAREGGRPLAGDEADIALSSSMEDLALRLAEAEARELREINSALLRIRDGSYGICEVTGKPINIRRLLAMPQARLSVEAQRKLELEQIRYDEEEGWVFTDDEYA